MFCPKCSQKQSSEETRYCSRCGFLLTGIAAVIENEGVIPDQASASKKKLSTPRKKGLKQGLFVLVMTFLLSPILMILAKELGFRPEMFILGIFVLLTAGTGRMLYAKLFESNEPEPEALARWTAEASRRALENKGNPAAALPPAETNPIEDFIMPAQGKWRETNDLAMSNVTEQTTRSLEK